MIAHVIQGGASHRVSCAREKLTQSDWLGAADLLPAARIEQAMQDEGVKPYQCLYTVPVTVWTFLTQVLGPDRCCRAAVAKLLAAVSFLNQRQCSGPDTAQDPSSRVPNRKIADDVEPDTGPYCKARDRLPVGLLARLARRAGADLHQRYPSGRLLGGRKVKMVDGTVVSMPDTPGNQASFPQPHTQKPGLGFPIMRVVAVLSLYGAAVLDIATGPYKGKGSGEATLFRGLLQGLETGDVILADRYYASYWLIAMLAQRGVDCLMRQHQHRRVDFRRGRRLGRDDHIIKIPKPRQMPDWMDEATYKQLPDELEVREVRVHVAIKGFRVKTLVAVTTLLDAQTYSKQEIGNALRCRWHIELDLRSIKQTMEMTTLRCKSPERVVKEIWMYMLAYNLIRAAMAEAANLAGAEPREVSFAGALQTLVAFAPALRMAGDVDLPRLWEIVLRAIARHRVGDRPDRYEPRAVKRRSKPIAILTVPRQKAKKRLARSAAAKC